MKRALSLPLLRRRSVDRTPLKGTREKRNAPIRGILICLLAMTIGPLGAGKAFADPMSALVSSAKEAQGPKSQNYKGVFLWGLEGGASDLSHEIHPGLASGWGGYVSGQALYGLWPNVLLGMDMDYYQVPVNLQSSGFQLGSVGTIALMPMVEFRTNRMGRWSFYGNIGVGMNDNNFNSSGALTSACGISVCSISMQISFAARFAVGADFYLSKNLSATVEGGYLMNYTPANVNVSIPGYSPSSSPGETLNLSTAFVLMGFHYNGTP